MGAHAERPHVDGKHEGILDRVMPIISWNIDPFEYSKDGWQLDRRESLRRRRLREVETNSGLLMLDLSGRMEMSRENEIRSFGDEECETGRQFERSPTESPSSQSTCHTSHGIIVYRVGRTAASE
jgi:hypothetical protein